MHRIIANNPFGVSTRLSYSDVTPEQGMFPRKYGLSDYPQIKSVKAHKKVVQETSEYLKRKVAEATALIQQ